MTLYTLCTHTQSLWNILNVVSKPVNYMNPVQQQKYEYAAQFVGFHPQMASSFD